MNLSDIDEMRSDNFYNTMIEKQAEAEQTIEDLREDAKNFQMEMAWKESHGE